METPQTVVFTQRAFNAIVTETISKHPIETGGIFLGYVMDNGTWIVVENIAPGPKSTHRSAYFEYDSNFVTYLANVIANQYKGNLRILGLWHRHPGSMDIFSNTDDNTNRDYAIDYPEGAISALVNCDPKWRMTMYHVAQDGQYELAEWYVDEGDIIPEELLELHYTNADNVPTFDKRGIIAPECETNEDIVIEDEQMSADAIAVVQPYTFRKAFQDIHIIMNKLIDNYLR